MPSTRSQSGYLIQSSSGTVGHFELVVPAPCGGLAHYWRNNDASGLPWSGPNSFGSGNWSNVALLQASWGYLEVVGQQGGRLGHFWRDFAWHGPDVFGSGIAGDPAFIQGRFGTPGNFEVVAPLAGGGLTHFFRDNGPLITQPWQGPFNFGSTLAYQGVALIHSRYGNLEIIARRGADLDFYWRNGSRWEGPFTIARGVANGTPAFIQSSFGRVGNFEVIVPRLGGGLAHFWRDNDDPRMPWHGPFPFGTGNISAVSFIQSSFGPGNLELVAREGNRLAFYWRTAGPPWTWNGPFYFAEQTIRLHFKMLFNPTSFTTAQMLDGMRQVYQTAGVRVELVSTEQLSLPALVDTNVGACDWTGPTSQQVALFMNRNGVSPGDLVIYFVRTTVPTLNGCATHPGGQPGAIVTSVASQWTLGHEVGHVLGLGHVGPTDRLMMGGGTWGITNPPPDLDCGEVDFIRGNSLTR
jgi:hypothetical protein